MRSEDVRLIGLKTADVPGLPIDGVAYISIEELAGVTVTLDEKHLTLDLLAGAARLDLTRIVKNYSPSPDAYTPSKGASAFFSHDHPHSGGLEESP